MRAWTWCSGHSTAWMWLSPACPAARHVDWKTVSWEVMARTEEGGGGARRAEKGEMGWTLRVTRSRAFIAG